VLTAVGPRLRALRKQRGATLEQLAESTGISVSTLSRLESGHRRPTWNSSCLSPRRIVFRWTSSSALRHRRPADLIRAR